MKNIALALLALFGLGLLVDPVAAQQAPSTDEIIQSLKPKVRTRGLAAPSISTEDSAFIQKLKVKTRGITIEERTQLSNIATAAAMPSIDLEVTFALNSAKLEPRAVQTLQRLGAALQSQELGAATFLVGGHTDARGARDYNQKLSEERARAVKVFLAENYRIQPERLIAVGYGQEQLKILSDPYADENRRVKVINLGRN